jgi:signal transduction histidine kinase
MSAAKGSFSVPLPEFVRTTTFRWTLVVSGAFTACVLLMFAFVLAQAFAYMTEDVDGLNAGIADSILAKNNLEQRIQRLDEYLRVDPHNVKFGGLFAGDGTRVAGNVESLPPGLKVDAAPQLVSLIRMGDANASRSVRAIARGLPEGGTLVVGRNDYEITWIVRSVERALALGLIPTLCIGLATGVFLSLRAQRRVEQVNTKIQRIVAGELRERLPTQGAQDPFDKLAGLVNGMLDEIEALIRRLAGVGDDIAHDLRTPLTRVRVGLERARQNARTLDELRSSVDQAIGGLDQSLAIITALLRIAEIEHSRRLDGFRHVDLAVLVREVGELYEPIAEDKGVIFDIKADEHLAVHGDRDLLFEAVANLVDNAVKFTPQGGCIDVTLQRGDEEAVVRVCDTGPGIPERERDFVGRRFYRADKSRCAPGVGLGLSLVNAIVKLHGFRLSISGRPGCCVEITAELASASTCSGRSGCNTAGALASATAAEKEKSAAPSPATARA